MALLFVLLYKGKTVMMTEKNNNLWYSLTVNENK